MSEHHEVERAYAVGPDDVLPDLGALRGVASVTEPRTATLVATYLDTDDLSLLRAGVTLRRRTGGDDEGWHLKVPAGDGRDEVHRPLGTEGVPADLARLVLGWTRGRVLGPVALIETVRTTTQLRDDTGAVLAEVADDVVVGTPADGREALAWRELEVELVGAGPDLLDAADDLLAAASDIHPRTEQRKIGTVLAERLAAVPTPPVADRDGAAGPVLLVRLHEQVAALQRSDCDVRRGVDDGVHQLRVACRRLRGALATFRPLVDRAVTDPVRDELGWLARTLGEGRDAEVVHDRLRALVDDLPADLVVGPVRARLDRSFADRRGSADRDAQELLDSERYLRLLDRLAELTTAPPWTDVADEPADTLMTQRVARDYRRLRRCVDHVDGSDPAAHDVALHEARKAAKRLRYACEVLEPWWGKDATRLRKAVQEITRVLGDRQDAVVGAVDLVRIAHEATAAGENAFTYGVLHARDQARSRELEAEFELVWASASRRGLRDWLEA
ncbi:CYTH and CHAD domain-containing protein [Nocardioides rubriscoriae]|uniref:CYTH and CHAD domain-containing protein n=1 Tax=Nocardioides rubriscoriae TaxID=642762 RepID=UPI0011DF7B0B|nr:CYTH and CHAD domain-containing protein [Nocardioides rubriscoriae]